MSNYSPKDYDVWECENIFFLKSHPARISKLLAHYELYKKIINLSGHILECGVYKGASLMRWAHFRQSLEKNEKRNIYGFDVFSSFPKKGIESSLDKKFIDEYDDGGGVGISKKKLEDYLNQKKFTNINLIEGNVLSTIDEFIKNKSDLKIALLHLDMDVYEPTKHALRNFSKYMTKGGIIIIDDYAVFDGATRATDEFCKENSLKIIKLSYHTDSSCVTSYIKC